MLNGFPLSCAAPRLLFHHHLPFSNLRFAVKPDGFVTVEDMKSDSLADPLASGAAGLLAIPLIELYAVLWRLGLVQVRTDRTIGRRIPTPMDVYCRARGLRRQPRRSPPRLSPAPAPTRSGRAGYSQAAG